MKGYQVALGVAIGLLPVTPASAQTPGMSTASTLSVPSDQPTAVLWTAAGTPADLAGQAMTPAPAKTPDQEKPAKGWNKWENKAFFTTLILTFGVDAGGFVQDDANAAQVGDQPTLVKWRAERINLVGQIKFKRPWTYQFGVAFNGLDADVVDHWTWLDARLDIPIPKVGRVKIGKQKIGVDSEWLMALTDSVFMERSVSSAFVPQRNVGVLVENSAAGERVLWSAGWFNDWFGNDNSFSDNGNQYHWAHQRPAGRRGSAGRHRRPGRRQRVLQGSEERQAAVHEAGRRSTSPTTSPTPASSQPITPSPRNSRRWPSRAAGSSSRMGR